MKRTGLSQSSAGGRQNNDTDGLEDRGWDQFEEEEGGVTRSVWVEPGRCSTVIRWWCNPSFLWMKLASLHQRTEMFHDYDYFIHKWLENVTRKQRQPKKKAFVNHIWDWKSFCVWNTKFLVILGGRNRSNGLLTDHRCMNISPNHSIRQFQLFHLHTWAIYSRGVLHRSLPFQSGYVYQQRNTGIDRYLIKYLCL